MRPVRPVAAALLLLAAPFPAAAQNAAVAVEPIRVIGTLTAVRSTTETSVPVDVIDEERLSETGATETGRAIQAAAPSFNFPSSTISDGTDALRPATLRGLGPDQTLVLVNGKRRHPSALVHVNGSVGRGTAGTDFNAIPLAAIGRVEVLRDGAAARYGSDAIAGVINLVLKEDAAGGEARATFGQTYEGDGSVEHMSVTQGASFRSGGFLTLTADLRERGRTNRAGLTGYCQYHVDLKDPNDADTQERCNEPDKESAFDRRNFRVGDAESESQGLWLNAEIPSTERVDLYLFGGLTRRDNTSGGFYRRANDAKNNPHTKHDLPSPRLSGHAPGYSDGFLPLINTEIKDESLGIGADIEAGRWNVDASMTHGANTFDYHISNSLNAYIWETDGRAVTEADAGGLGFRQTSLNLDGQTSVNLFGVPAELAVGAEHRVDNYRIRPGEEDSWFGCAHTASGCNNDDPIGGIQVFPGFQPTNAVNESRASTAVYADGELGVSPRTSVGVALRGENYDDIGSTLNGRLTARFQATPAIALRGSANTGFRAPSLHQKYFNNISTQFTDSGERKEVFTVRNDDLLTQELGIPELDEETSLNAAIGFVWSPSPAFSLTFDAYEIDIKDRIMISRAVNRMELVTACGGVTTCESAVTNKLKRSSDTAQFFLNAGRTRTKGIDLVAEHRSRVAGGDLRLTAAATWNQTRFRGFNSPGPLGNLGEGLFGAADKAYIEVAQPESRLNFETAFEKNRWAFTVGTRTYGSYTVQETSSGRQKYGARTLVDTRLSYAITDRVTFSIGADNLFDVYPSKQRFSRTRAGCIEAGGRRTDPGSCANPIIDSDGVFQYSRRSAPFGINGGFYYARLVWNW